MPISYIVDAHPGSTEQIMKAYKQAGYPILDVIQLPNISKILEHDVFLFHVERDLNELELYVPGVIIVEGGIELIYNILPGFPLNPKYLLAVALQKLPFKFQQQLIDRKLLDLFRAPIQSNLFQELPFGSPGLTLGSESSPGAYAQQGGMDEILDTMGVKEAWKENQGDGTVIAVFDTGCLNIPAESRAGSWTNIPGGSAWDDSEGHGSMTSRIALTVAPKAKIYALRPAPDEKGVLSSSSIYQSVDHLLGWALENPNVPLITNNSWGISGCLDVFLPGDILGVRLARPIDERGIATICFAAGNSRDECGASAISIYTIASMKQAASAAALTRELKPQFYSSRGPGTLFPWHPTISAPTWGILPWGSGYRDFGEQGGGTSSCAPMMAGALAIMRSAFPKAKNSKLRSALRGGADNAILGRPGVVYDVYTGSGLMRVDRSLQEMRRPGPKTLFFEMTERLPGS